METMAGAEWAREFARLRAGGMAAMAALRATFPLREAAREARKVVVLFPAAAAALTKEAA